MRQASAFEDLSPVFICRVDVFVAGWQHAHHSCGSDYEAPTHCYQLLRHVARSRRLVGGPRRDADCSCQQRHG